jgi:hypothetical protein
MSQHKELVMKKYLLAIAAAMLATPALAWPDKFTLNNSTVYVSLLSKELFIGAITLTDTENGNHFSFLAGDIGPGHSTTFQFFKTPPCTWFVTISPKVGPAITAPKTFDSCHQTTITVAQYGYDQPYNFIYK